MPNPVIRPRRGLVLQVFVALLIIALIVARRPSAIFLPQFWAEDGAWFSHAYTFGAQTLTWPHAGYLQSISRLAALLQAQLPLSWGPLCFAMLSVGIQALPPIFLLSGRFDPVLPSRPVRLLLALFWVAVPNASEIHVNLTDAMWHMSLLSFLIVASPPPRRRWASVAELTGLVLSGLSGPFCLFLTPLAWWRAWREPNSAIRARAWVLTATVCVQAAFLVPSVFEVRPKVTLGATFPLLCRIIIAQIGLGGMAGTEFSRDLMASPLLQPDWVMLAFGAAMTVCGALAFYVGSELTRLFLVFAALMLGSSLATPLVSFTEPQWPFLASAVGGRYFTVPILAWFVTCLVIAASGPRLLRVPFVAMIAAFAVGAAHDFRYPAQTDYGFHAEALAFERSEPGKQMKFLIPPVGWSFSLIRR
jgi:hypothetical protein